MTIGPEALPLLRDLAGKYIWWKSPADAVSHVERVIAQVMTLGEFDDMERLAAVVGDDALRQVVRTAEPGVFDERSWTYWHYRLGLAELGGVPPLPRRIVA